MTAAGQSSRDQARLWLAAFVVSAALNALILLAFGLDVLSRIEFMPSRRTTEELARALKPPETVALIVPEIVAATPAPQAAPAEPEKPPTPPPQEPSFARTSRDQESDRPENPAFIGERNTRATSDLQPEETAKVMPNQEGEEPDDEGEMETTVSRHQDGDLFHDTIARPKPTVIEPELPTGPDSPKPMRTEAAAAPAAAPPPAPLKNDLVQGPFPVEREVTAAKPEEESKTVEPVEPPPEEKEAKAEEEKDLPKAADEKKAMADKDRPGQDNPPTRPAPSAAPSQPGFRGYQYKHRIHGSISRQGRSAHDVEDSVLGRYHAALSRAVEKEWQLNCIRNRDYITPGQIIVRFVLEANGKVRSINFVEEFGVGNIQKGFTSESIRSADIPPFPAEMKKQLGADPLEVTYSFTF